MLLYHVFDLKFFFSDTVKVQLTATYCMVSHNSSSFEEGLRLALGYLETSSWSSLVGNGQSCSSRTKAVSLIPFSSANFLSAKQCLPETKTIRWTDLGSDTWSPRTGWKWVPDSISVRVDAADGWRSRIFGATTTSGFRKLRIIWKKSKENIFVALACHQH